MQNLTAPKRVSSGKYLDLAALTKDDIELSDINHSLNLIYRFTGHYKNKKPLTVAQHTKLVLMMATKVFPGERAVFFDCLIHDFPEAYTGDIATPLKRLFGEAYKAYEKGVEDVVYEKLWIIDEPFTEEVYQKRKVCDLLSLDIERRAMWIDQTGKSLWPNIPNEGLISLKDKQALFETVQNEGDVDLEKLYWDTVNDNS